MGNILSRFCCCKCVIAQTLKKELNRDKHVEIIYKEIIGQDLEINLPYDTKIEYV